MRFENSNLEGGGRRGGGGRGVGLGAGADGLADLGELMVFLQLTRCEAQECLYWGKC